MSTESSDSKKRQNEPTDYSGVQLCPSSYQTSKQPTLMETFLGNRVDRLLQDINLNPAKYRQEERTLALSLYSNQIGLDDLDDEKRQVLDIAVTRFLLERNQKTKPKAKEPLQTKTADKDPMSFPEFWWE